MNFEKDWKNCYCPFLVAGSFMQWESEDLQDEERNCKGPSCMLFVKTDNDWNLGMCGLVNRGGTYEK
ncbi:MAG: hypothetical protein ACOCUL_04680 [Bacteroidota bacterium]